MICEVRMCFTAIQSWLVEWHMNNSRTGPNTSSHKISTTLIMLSFWLRRTTFAKRSFLKITTTEILLGFVHETAWLLKVHFSFSINVTLFKLFIKSQHYKIPRSKDKFRLPKWFICSLRWGSFVLWFW